MKKYHIADALSALEIVSALTILTMIPFKVSPDIVIWLFVLGELCDAFDGPFARHFPYPDDGKYRWWRVPHTVQAIEHLSDILLLSALGFFLLTQTNPVIRYVTLFAGVAIAVFCIFIELCIKVWFKSQLNDRQRLTLIRRRRLVYLMGIAIGIVEFIFITSWPEPIKTAVYCIGALIGIILALYKWDRLTETKETFLDFLKRHFPHQHH